jgi:hypothetical protein
MAKGIKKPPKGIIVEPKRVRFWWDGDYTIQVELLFDSSFDWQRLEDEEFIDAKGTLLEGHEVHCKKSVLMGGGSTDAETS